MEEQKSIRKFFAGIFIDKEKLEENNIEYPVKLEYYKLKNIENYFGIEIVKTEYHDGYTKFENNVIAKVTKEERNIENIINTLKKNLVTPIHLQDVIEEVITTNI